MFGLMYHLKYCKIESSKWYNGIIGVVDKSDNIIVRTRTIHEHYESVCKLLECLSNAELTVNWGKCELFKDEHKLMRDGVNLIQ